MASSQPTTIIHDGISCDICHCQPIRGSRFRCATCPRFDMCARCESAGHHQHHPMLRMPNPAPLPQATSVDTTVHNGIRCNICDVRPIRGTRFKCKSCADFDMCSSCEAAGNHQHHTLLRMANNPNRGGLDVFDRVFTNAFEENNRVVRCDVCHQVLPIRGPRFHCGVCAKFDMCVSCEAIGNHRHHPIQRIDNTSTDCRVQ